MQKRSEKIRKTAAAEGNDRIVRPAAEPAAMLEARGVTKTFGAVTALDAVDLTLNRGEVLGLIGENGSGKSTLTSIIAGMQKADKGSITLKGKRWTPASMVDAAAKGVGMVVQESGVIAGITITENIFLGEAKAFSKLGFLTRSKADAKAREALASVGAGEIDVTLPAAVLDLQDRKIIEIAKVWAKSPEVLIIDETTTAVSQRGREIVYGLLEKQKEQNRSAIFISHDLDEILQVCDRVTVLRDGHIIGSLGKAEFDGDKIKQLMIGRELKGDYYRSDYGGQPGGGAVLKAEGLTSAVLKNVSLELKKGEILGIGGLSHCGMHELGKALFGAARLKSGKVTAVESGTLIKNEAGAIKCGLGYASKDRDLEAIILNAPIRDNIVSAGLAKLRRLRFFIFPRDEKAYSQKQIDALKIKCSSGKQYVSELSGGNKQKIVFAKWVGAESGIMILDCPTRGVDIGVKQAMYQLIYRLRNEGVSVVMISEELQELIGMSDRILIMKNGAVTKEFLRDRSLTEADIIGHMV